MSKKTSTQTLLRQFKPKTKNQSDYIRAIAENQIVIALGPAGSGKSAVATALACEHLFYNKIEKIIITRPIVEAGRSQGFLPGSILEKSMPFMIPILDELNLSLNPIVVQSLIREGRIEILPLAYMRGRNFHNCFVIADEMSNATHTELKLLLTRIGINSKIVLTGDPNQSDLHFNDRGALEHIAKVLVDIPEISVIQLTDIDIVRNPIISKILARLN